LKYVRHNDDVENSRQHSNSYKQCLFHKTSWFKLKCVLSTKTVERSHLGSCTFWSRQSFPWKISPILRSSISITCMSVLVKLKRLLYQMLGYVVAWNIKSIFSTRYGFIWSRPISSFLLGNPESNLVFFLVFAIDNKSPEPVRFSLIFCLCPSIVAQKSFFLRSENPSVRPTNCMIYTRSFNFLPISSHWLSIFCEFVRR